MSLSTVNLTKLLSFFWWLKTKTFLNLKVLQPISESSTEVWCILHKNTCFYRWKQAFILCRCYSWICENSWGMATVGDSLYQRPHCLTGRADVILSFFLWFQRDSNFTPTCVLWQISNGVQLQRLTLLYFDHLLRRNVTGLAACAIPKMSDQLPFVTCRKNEIAVNLPLGTRLNRIKTVGTGVPTGSLLLNPGAQFVKISTSEDKVRRPFLFQWLNAV